MATTSLSRKDIERYDKEFGQSNIVTNEQGGRQSKIAGRMTEVPPLALLAVSAVMGAGSVTYPRESDGTPNWHRIDSMSNLDHGLEHAARFCHLRNKPRYTGSKCSSKAMYKELSHHAARAMMALEMFMKENPEAYKL